MTGHRRAARLISTGSAALCRRYGAWLLPGRWQDTGKRLLGTAAAAWMLGGMLLATPALAWLLAGAWLTTAWRTGRALDRQERNEAAFVQLLRDLTGERRGVLLADVLAVLAARPDAHPDMTIGHVRQQCEALDIPIRDSLKVDGRVSPGVHLDDLTAAWDVTPTPPPATTGSPSPGAVTSNNYPTTPTVTPIAEGVAWVIHPTGPPAVQKVSKP